MKKLYLLVFLATLCMNAFAQFSFTQSDTVGCAPLSVTFTNTSAAGVNYVWYYGDGEVDSIASTIHIYQTPGSYYPYLYAYDNSWNYLGMSYGKPVQVNSKGEIYFFKNPICPDE